MKYLSRKTPLVIFVLLIISLILLSSDLKASEVVQTGVDDKVIAISNLDVNLVEMPEDVVEVYAAKGKKVSFEIRGKNIYIGTSEESPFSIFINCGETQYGYLVIPRPIKSQHIKIVDWAKDKSAEKDKIKEDRFSIIRNVMASMIEGSPFHGRIWEGRSESSIKGRDIEAFCTGIWEGIVKGIRYEVRNISNDSLKLYEEDFWIPGVLAVALEKEILKPGETGNIYIINNK